MVGPSEAYEDKGRHLIKAFLAQCGLTHWYPVLSHLLEHYDGLERLVDDEQHAPLASLLHLLRGMARVSAKPTDEEFAGLIANLEFLEYRVRRTGDGRLTFEDGETWDPSASDLQAFAEGRPLGGWRQAQHSTEYRHTATELLKLLRRRNDRAR